MCMHTSDWHCSSSSSSVSLCLPSLSVLSKMISNYRLLLSGLLLLLLLRLPLARSDGRLYIGFTTYHNDNNRRSDGQCCDGEEDSNGHCPDSCDLIIQVSVEGLDGPSTTRRRPTDVPFNSSDLKLANNPLTFTFSSWPDRCLDVLVEILDVDDQPDGNETETMEPVDTMTLSMVLVCPSDSYKQYVLTGRRSSQPSNLTVVIRFSNGSDPQHQLVDSSEQIADCPVVTPSPVWSSSLSPSSSQPDTTVSITPPPTSSFHWSSTPLMTSYEPEMTSDDVSSDLPESTRLLQPLTLDVSSAMTTVPLVVTSSMDSAHTTILTTSSTSMQQPNPTPTPATRTSLTSSTPATDTTGSMSSAIVTTPSTTSRRDVVTNGPPVTPKEKGDDDSGGGIMDYWPVILGSILAVLVLISIIGFIVYYRRRRAIVKHQEIYTVTPRIVSVVEENGTAGRSDVPVETAEY